MKNIGFVGLVSGLLLTADVFAQSDTEIQSDVAETYEQNAQGDVGMQGQQMRGRVAMLNMSRVRHQYVWHNGFDSEYAPKRNPISATEENSTAGRQLFVSHCQSCHGEEGIGDGEAGKELNPPPSNIARFAKTTMATDPYLMWTINEGGAPIGSAMPAYKGVLKEDDIWKVIYYLRQMQ